MRISVNAPSYKRAGDVRTLKYMPFCRIWVDFGEYDEYCEKNPGAEIVSCPRGVQGNVSRVRNWILKSEFERGIEAVLIVDDDLAYIERYDVDKESGFGYVRHKIETEDIMHLVEKYSIMAQELGAKQWGMSPNSDARNLIHFRPFSTNQIVLGPFSCFLHGNRCWYDENLPLKEDYDMALQQLEKERVILRVNYLHYFCDQSHSAGGCAAYRNREREEEQFRLLQKKWGERIVHRDGGGKDGTAKVRLFEDYNPIIKVPIKGI